MIAGQNTDIKIREKWSFYKYFFSVFKNKESVHSTQGQRPKIHNLRTLTVIFKPFFKSYCITRCYSSVFLSPKQSFEIKFPYERCVSLAFCQLWCFNYESDATLYTNMTHSYDDVGMTYVWGNIMWCHYTFKFTTLCLLLSDFLWGITIRWLCCDTASFIKTVQQHKYINLKQYLFFSN